MAHHKQHDAIHEELENQQLIQDLHYLYDTHTADAQSLAHIRSRLVQHASIPISNEEDSNIITFQPLDTPEKGDDAIIPATTRYLNEWRNARRHWSQLVSTIAALVIITALIGSVVLVFSRHSSTPAHKGLLPASPSGRIQKLHMVDARTGWAIAQTRHDNSTDSFPALIRTTDGGETWQDVTPAEQFIQPTSIEGSDAPITTFLSGNTAWVAFIPQGSNDTPLYFTHNGGQTWSESLIPTGNPLSSIIQMNFIDALHGWVLTASVETTPLYTQDATLLQTVDGGKTWSTVVRANDARSLSDNAPGALPFAGTKTGFTFISTQTGWIVGQTQRANFLWLYVTYDGGHTWQHQDMPRLTLPTGFSTENMLIQLQAPTFFGGKDGVLPFAIPIQQGMPTENINAADGELVGSYITHDSGRSWQSTHSIQEINIATLHGPQFVDMHYAIYTQHNYVVFQSLDASTEGDTSSPLNSAPIGTITQSSFVSRTVGWVLLNTMGHVVDPLRLYQTTDGGKTWKQVNYSVQRQQAHASLKLNTGWNAVASYIGKGVQQYSLYGAHSYAQIASSREWGLIFSCTGTGTKSYAAILNGLTFAGDLDTSISLSGMASDCSGKPTQMWNTYQMKQVPVDVLIKAEDTITWNVLVVECTNAQGCSDSPSAT